jgi:hypothetical protein
MSSETDCDRGGIRAPMSQPRFRRLPSAEMSNIGLRPFIVVLAVLALGTAAGCGKGSSGGTSSPPAGVKQPVWTDYCARNASLTNTIQQALNGALSAAALVPQLNGIEQAINQDATGSPDPTKSQFQALANAIDAVKVAVTNGVEPNYGQITSAFGPIPTCSK